MEAWMIPAAIQVGSALIGRGQQKQQMQQGQLQSAMANTAKPAGISPQLAQPFSQGGLTPPQGDPTNPLGAPPGGNPLMNLGALLMGKQNGSGY